MKPYRKMLKYTFTFALVALLLNISFCQEQAQESGLATSASSMDYLQISQDFLYAIKTEEPTDSLAALLAKADAASLQAQLNDDARKKAFWLNIYNAFVQHLLLKSPDLYEERNKFFTKALIEVAGKKLSLDDIEHGILRRSKIKYSWGYANKWFPGSFEKRFRVAEVDERIHFALNCGAHSCPPIAFYKAENIDRQLDLATLNFLKDEIQLDEQKQTITIPKLFSWFRGDFGGKKGMLRFLKKHQLLAQDLNPAIRYSDYNWKLSLAKYQPQP